MASIARALEQVRERITLAAQKAGRDPATVRLLAVSKTKPVEAIVEAYEAGQRDFGENYLQELADKAQQLAHLEGIRWHAIGHIQTNKAKVAARFASSVHTVDSTKIAEALGRRRAQVEGATPLRVFVEVNVAEEAQKAGCSAQTLPEVLEAVEQHQSLELVGLMTVPPHSEDPEGARPYFERLRELSNAHGGRARLPELSMGMSHDLEVAVAAGASIVRVGTAIFGARAKPYRTAP